MVFNLTREITAASFPLSGNICIPKIKKRGRLPPSAFSNPLNVLHSLLLHLPETLQSFLDPIHNFS